MLRVAYIVGILSFFVSACDSQGNLSQADILTRGPNSPITDVRNPTSGTKSLSVYTETSADECSGDACDSGAANSQAQTIYDFGSHDSVNCDYELSAALKQLVLVNDYQVKTWISASQAVTASGDKSAFSIDRVASYGAPASIYMVESSSAVNDSLFSLFDQDGNEVGFIFASDFGDPNSGSGEVNNGTEQSGPLPTDEYSYLSLHFQCDGAIVDNEGAKVQDLEFDYSQGMAKFIQIFNLTMDSIGGSTAGGGVYRNLTP